MSHLKHNRNKQDRNFNDIAELFAQNIYGTNKGKLRQIMLRQDLSDLLSTMPDRPLRILDAGGGEGLIACDLAAMGHQVVHCDISIRMSERAQQRAKELNVTDNMTFICSPIQSIEKFHLGTFDIVLCHAMLEWSATPEKVIETLKQCLSPDGKLSLMFYNYYGLLFQNVTNGNLEYVNLGMPKKKKRTLSPDYPLKPEDVYLWLAQNHLLITQKTGIRVFHDYLKDKDLQQRSFNQILTLEQRYCREEPYIQYARYIHVVAKIHYA